MKFLKVIHLSKSEYRIIDDTSLLLSIITYLGNLLKKQLQPGGISGQVYRTEFTNLLVAVAVAMISISAFVFIFSQEFRQEIAALNFSLISSIFALLFTYSSGEKRGMLWLTC